MGTVFEELIRKFAEISNETAGEHFKPREVTDDDKLVYVNNAIKGKLLESAVLVQQASNHTKEQFSNSPDLANGILNAIMDAFTAHSAMSKQALDSEKVRSGLKDALLGPAQLYEALRARGESTGTRIKPNRTPRCPPCLSTPHWCIRLGTLSGTQPDVLSVSI